MYPLINVLGIDSRRRLNLLQLDRVVLIWLGSHIFFYLFCDIFL